MKLQMMKAGIMKIVKKTMKKISTVKMKVKMLNTLTMKMMM